MSTKEPEFGFPKPKRIVNEEVLETIRALPCLACRPGSQETDTEAHHITTRGAGGDDVMSNLMPLCHRHHMEWHQHTSMFIRENVSVRYWLENMGRNDVLERVERRQR